MKIKNLEEWHENNCSQCYNYYMSDNFLGFSFFGKEKNLLQKHYNNISSKYKLIIGPESIYYFKINIPKLGEKKILIFGDIHDKIPHLIRKMNGIHYDDLLIDIILKCEERNHCVDFYLETILTKYKKKLDKRLTYDDSLFGGSQIGTSEKTLGYIRRVFKQCSESTDKCKILNKKGKTHIDINNLRTQNIDLRLDSPELMAIIEDIVDSDEDIKIEEMFTLINYILGYIDKIDDTIDTLTTNIEIDPAKKRIISHQLKFIREKTIKEYKKYKLNKDLPNIKDAIFNYIKLSQHKILNKDLLGTLLMDIYALLRMFMNFNETYMNRGHMLCRNAFQDRIIIYAGESHIINYVEIINLLFPDSVEYQVTSKHTFLNYYDDTDSKKMVQFNDNTINNLGFNNFYDLLMDYCK
jgi:hypothetical protein